jgi:hypothetical protein
MLIAPVMELIGKSVARHIHQEMNGIDCLELGAFYFLQYLYYLPPHQADHISNFCPALKMIPEPPECTSTR